jgi:hypothetical protein
VIGIHSDEWKSVAAKLFLNLKFLLLFDIPLQKRKTPDGFVSLRRRKAVFNNN